MFAKRLCNQFAVGKGLPFTIALTLVASPAFGHDETIGGAGFVTGMLHPVLGFDHLLAMLCVGVLSVQIGGRAIWYIPGAFVAVMMLGGFLGMNDIAVPAVESGIALSVLVLGAAIMFGNAISRWAALVCVGIFGIFHGHAHGTEMPLIADPLLYGFGFVVGTAIIHLTGVALGFLVRRRSDGHIKLRYSGAIVSLAGAYFLYSGLVA